MNWIKIESEADLEKAIEVSSQENLGIAIFKHSAFRDLSGLIAEKFNIQHESPQLLVIKNGKCIYDASHMSISVKSIRTELVA